jgi:hypothetical protein
MATFCFLSKGREWKSGFQEKGLPLFTPILYSAFEHSHVDIKMVTKEKVTLIMINLTIQLN